GYVGLLRGRGNGGEDVAVLIDGRIFQADRVEFLHEQIQKVVLLGRARIGRAVLIRLGVDDDVSKKPVENAGRCRHSSNSIFETVRSRDGLKTVPYRHHATDTTP